MHPTIGHLPIAGAVPALLRIRQNRRTADHADMLVETMATRRYLTQRRALLDIATHALEHLKELDASEVDRMHELKALRAG